MTKIKLMQKIVITVAVFIFFFFINTSGVFATGCDPTKANSCNNVSQVCKVDNQNVPNVGTCQGANIQVDKPEKGFATLGNAISNIITVAFAVAVLIVLVMLIWGAFEWIVSGGDKEAVGKARGRIINALIGLAVLAIAFALARVAGQFTGLDLQNLVIPQPDPSAKGL